MNQVKERIRSLLNEGNNSEAFRVLTEAFSSELSAMKDDSEYCILAASVFLAEEKNDIAFDVIAMGLINDDKNYELYVLLGEYYMGSSLEQALICIKQACFYCTDDNDRAFIRQYIDNISEQGVIVPRVTFVIESDGDQRVVDRCIDSIKCTVPDDEYGDIYVVKCLNDGISAADPLTDIFVMDSRAYLFDNSFFYLMLARYSDASIGAVGGLLNKIGHVNAEQGLCLDVTDTEQVEKAARNLNSPLKDSYERKVYLSKEALLISRTALEEIGLFDEDLKGAYDDIDICVRINLAGFKVILAYNSFIMNDGIPAGRYGEEVIQESRALMKNKWNCDLTYSCEARSSIIEMIDKDRNESLEVLELGCALGSTLNRIRFSWPCSSVHGIEYVDGAAKIAGSIIDVIQGDVESMDIPYDKGQFDYIICADVLEHLRNPEETIKRFLPCLKDDGHFIISIPNVRYYAVCMMLMQHGRFDYAESGILDRTHLRFFTRSTAIEMLENCGLEVLEIKENYNGNDQENDFVKRLKDNFEIVDPDELNVFQYYFLAGRKKSTQIAKKEKSSEHRFNTLVVITPKDFERLIGLYSRLTNNIGYGKVLFVGAEGVNEILGANRNNIGDAGFVNEDSVIPFDSVHALMKKKMDPILEGRELPRGITGWYYQQFLKMQYAFICKDEYYMVWDGDTIPCRNIKMFQDGSGKPYLDMKHEYHQEYFDTMEIILPGFSKVIERSFISEHMLIRAEYMREMVAEIEKNDAIEGEKFWEKIINAIPVDKIQSSSFSEFETYGTFVAIKHCSTYVLREWHSFRLGGSFFNIDTISDRDFNWLAKDFDAISFEKGHTVREDNANLFDNPYYQENLTPKQMLQAAQMEFKEGYKEVWEDDSDTAAANVSSGAFTSAADVFEVGNRLLYLSEDSYRIYDKLGDELINNNKNQAFLCYENAEFLCDDDVVRNRIFEKKMRLIDMGEVSVRKTAFVILSYNNTYLMQRCLESIYTNCNPDSYLLIVFDNGSTDGVAQWLTRFGEDHDDAVIILNESNLGFSGGCNEAFKYIPDGYDVLFINNDVRVPANALFWLRMALYEAEDVGGVGAVQNYMTLTRGERVNFGAIEQYMEYGASVNVPMDNPYEEQCMLCGFAMLLRRDVYDRTQGFDERFNPGYLEDDDISLQIRELGYRLLLVHNAFIYHAGTQSFRERDDLKQLFDAHRKIIVDKWQFESRIAGSISENEMEFIESLEKKGYERNSSFSVLHIGCGCGCMLGHIHYLYPNAEVAGIEEDDNARKFAISCIPVYKAVEVLPRKVEEYDVIAKDLG